MRRGLRGLKNIKVVNKAGGKQYKYRRVGAQLVRLPDLPENHPDFLAAYVAAGEADSRPKLRTKPGSIDALCIAYLGSYEYRRLAANTRANRRRVIEKIRSSRGQALLSDLRAEHLRRDIRSFTPAVAQMRLDTWRVLLRFAVDEGLIAADPSAGLRAPKGATTPHRQWTRDELRQFRDRWPVGSPERTAFEVIYWTGARCVDARNLGWQNVDNDGWLSFIQAKTGGPATCPILTLPEWAEPMAEDHRFFLASISKNRAIWAASKTGKPRNAAALSNFISEAAAAAGLPNGSTAHGLRKARAAALASSGATVSRIGAWTGHTSLKEIAHYTRQADQKGVLGGGRDLRGPEHPKFYLDFRLAARIEPQHEVLI